ncbi:hypothetical protein BDA99DRAFT_539973 [Phascolomyces articulosus]|uniref:Uncharacterized protein n=1 Tax=Phascolomyces articulosus TaxID=60185 RepID=A0AAD5K535_9FUNG|nr:hypothetical protein BDA99DRAFT_539973 [Phascolomyces articulosus]
MNGQYNKAYTDAQNLIKIASASLRVPARLHISFKIVAEAGFELSRCMTRYNIGDADNSVALMCSLSFLRDHFNKNLKITSSTAESATQFRILKSLQTCHFDNIQSLSVIFTLVIKYFFLFMMAPQNGVQNKDEQYAIDISKALHLIRNNLNCLDITFWDCIDSSIVTIAIILERCRNLTDLGHNKMSTKLSIFTGNIDELDNHNKFRIYQSIRDSVTLKDLELRGLYNTDKLADILLETPPLKRLSITGGFGYGYYAINQGFNSLSLESLYLGGHCEVLDATLKIVTGIKTLKKITFATLFKDSTNGMADFSSKIGYQLTNTSLISIACIKDNVFTVLGEQGKNYLLLLQKS